MESLEKKKYTPPEIIFETNLETKAGSPLSDPGRELEILPGTEG